VHPERPLPRRRPPAHGHPHLGGPRAAALLDARALQGHRGRPGAGRVRGPHPGPPGAQKTDAIQSNKNLILSREALVDSLPPARDPGRRRQVQARLHDRPARSAGPLSTCARAGSARRRREPCSRTRSRATSCSASESRRCARD
jgi:hypothetical protein